MLMDDESYLLHFKAIALARFLLHSLEKSSLEADLLDLGIHTEFLKALFKAIVYHSSTEVRSLAFKNFERYFSLFTVRGRYRLVNFVLRMFNHSGLIGYTVTQVSI
jgi:hypothetical protein